MGRHGIHWLPIEGQRVRDCDKGGLGTNRLHNTVCTMVAVRIGGKTVAEWWRSVCLGGAEDEEEESAKKDEGRRTGVFGWNSDTKYHSIYQDAARTMYSTMRRGTAVTAQFQWVGGL